MAEQGKTQINPWGSTIGLLTACFATLMGVLSGLEPHVILSRAVTAGVALGIITSILVLALGRFVAHENKSKM